MPREKDIENMFVFVIMPFNEDLTHIYVDFVKPAFEEEGFEITRADGFKNQQNILKDIVQGIHRADLIVAEVSEINANVFYELGVAHGLNKPTILITQSLDTLPFDLLSYKVIKYSAKYYNPVGYLKDQLKVLAQEFKQSKLEFGNPVSDFLPTSIMTVKQENSDLDATTSTDFHSLAIDNQLSMTEDINEIAVILNLLAENANSRTSEINAALQLGSRSSYLITNIIQALVNDLTNFTEGIEKKLPRLRKEWDDMRKAFSGLLSYNTIANEEDKEAVINFQANVRQMNSSLIFSLQTLRVLYESLSKLNVSSRNLSTDLDAISLRCITAMEKLLDVLSIGEAYLFRIINLCDEKLTEYNSSMENTQSTSQG